MTQCTARIPTHTKFLGRPMSKRVNMSEKWVTYPHGPLEKLADNLWCVQGTLPHMPIGRAMTVVKKSTGSLVLHSPIALDDEGMRHLEAIGEIDTLLIPNGWHRIDLARYAKRYPSAAIYAPSGAVAKVEELAKLTGTYETFPRDPAIELETLRGVGEAEGVVKVSSHDGATLIFNDCIFNLDHFPGIFGTVYRFLGSTGGPKVTRIFRMMAAKSKNELYAHLAELSSHPSLKRIVMSHGKLIDEKASDVLREIAGGR